MKVTDWVLDESWADIQQIAIYGFGRTAQGNIDQLINEFQVSVIIDNNDALRGRVYRNVPIVNWDYFKKTKNNDKIVILAAGKARISISETLITEGKKRNIDFTDLDVFACEWYLRFRNKLCLGKITTAVTTKCTFNCINCNMLMPYYKKQKDYSYEQLTKDADLFFILVDFVTSFVIIGGEPFLYIDLIKYLKYIGEHYGKKIGNIQLITNGSVLPSIELLQVIKKYNIEIRISDYTLSIHYEKRIRDFIQLLDKYEIKHIEFIQTEWIDFGFPHDIVNMGKTKDELRKHMLNCHGMCHWLHSGKYFYCSNAWAAQECGMFRLKAKNDYIELNELIEDHEDGKHRLVDFYMGNLPDGYMSFCKFCRGFGSEKTIEAGVQAKRS